MFWVPITLLEWVSGGEERGASRTESCTVVGSLYTGPGIGTGRPWAIDGFVREMGLVDSLGPYSKLLSGSIGL